MIEISRRYEYLLRTGKRVTRKIETAREMAKRTGRPAIDFISEPLRAIFLKAYPDLAKSANGRKAKKSA